MEFNKEAFAANIRSSRAKLRMSQKDLAEVVGVSVNTIFEYEQGDGCTPGADKVIAICNALGKSPNELFGWEEQR